jgi:uncharacterized membrane protein YhaH (DUF805 family)
MDYFWLLFSFKGRVNRARYLAVQLVLLAFWLILWLKFSFDFASGWEAMVIVIAMIWVNAATTAKRLHDRNRSGWWAVAVFGVNRLCWIYYSLFFGLAFGVDISIAWEMLLVLVAIALSLLQTWALIELVFLIGTDGRNRFGADPMRTDAHSSIDVRAMPVSVPDFLVCHAGLPRRS